MKIPENNTMINLNRKSTLNELIRQTQVKGT